MDHFGADDYFVCHVMRFGRSVRRDISSLSPVLQRTQDLGLSAIPGFLALCITTSIYKQLHILYTANIELRCYKFFLLCPTPPTFLEQWYFS